MMNLIRPITYKALHNNEYIVAEMIEGLCRVKNSHHAEVLVQVGQLGSLVTLNVFKNDSLLNDDLLLVAVEYILGHTKEITHVEIKNFNPDSNANFILQKYF